MHRIALRPRRAWRGLAVLALAAAAACAPSIRPALHAPCGREGCAAGGIPVLAWHGFADQAGREQGSLTESFHAFEEMLAFLSAHGFRSVFPSQARRGDARQVILTFDDGRKEQLRAAEMMERHGFRGIFFVIPNRVRSGNPRFLDAADLERLARAGHRVAAHGYDHRSLPGSGTEVAASLVRSPWMLGGGARRTAGEDFAFPFGHYTAEIAEAVAGRYRWLHTVNPGYWDGASALVPRMLIMTGVDPALFRAYVLGGGSYRPTLRPLTPDGAVAGRVAFLSRGLAAPDSLELFAITADAAGESYVSRPLGELAQVAGDTLWVDLAGYMRRHYPPGRMVISYALMRREGGEPRYASPGVMHWIADPVTGPRAMPQRAGHDPRAGRALAEAADADGLARAGDRPSHRADPAVREQPVVRGPFLHADDGPGDAGGLVRDRGGQDAAHVRQPRHPLRVRRGLEPTGERAGVGLRQVLLLQGAQHLRCAQQRRVAPRRERADQLVVQHLQVALQQPARHTARGQHVAQPEHLPLHERRLRAAERHQPSPVARPEQPPPLAEAHQVVRMLPQRAFVGAVRGLHLLRRGGDGMPPRERVHGLRDRCVHGGWIRGDPGQVLGPGIAARCAPGRGSAPATGMNGIAGPEAIELKSRLQHHAVRLRGQSPIRGRQDSLSRSMNPASHPTSPRAF